MRGPALCDIDGASFAAAAIARLTELRLAADLDRIEADLRAGTATSAMAELEQFTAEHPLHEHAAILLVRALAASGRQADGLRVVEEMRSRLADELGVDLSAALQEAHLRVLRGDLLGRSSPGPVGCVQLNAPDVNAAQRRSAPTAPSAPLTCRAAASARW